MKANENIPTVHAVPVGETPADAMVAELVNGVIAPTVHAVPIDGELPAVLAEVVDGVLIPS